MNDDTHRERIPSLERLAFGALWALLLAPVLAHGLWRPLVHVLGPAGSAGAITGAALAVSGTMALVQALRHRHAPLLSMALECSANVRAWQEPRFA